MPDSLSARVAARLGTGPARQGAGAASPGGARPATVAPTRTGPPASAVAGMVRARGKAELMLMPGELYFGAEATSVKTLLGSCVALTLWHPQRRIGGMCHYLLPERRRNAGEPLDGRYGEEAVQAMVEQLERHGCRGNEFVAHLYGGADTMAEQAGVKLNVGERNIERGWTLIDRFGFTLDGVDVGDNVPRTVTLTLACGTVECRRGASS